MFKPIIFALTAAAIAANSGAAAAQMACGERHEIMAALDGKYQEKPRAYGFVGEKVLVELFTSKKGSWTVLMTEPKGPSCIIATGLNWEELPVEKEMTGL
jgi:hypothetical protein